MRYGEIFIIKKSETATEIEGGRYSKIDCMTHKENE